MAGSSSERDPKSRASTHRDSDNNCSGLSTGARIGIGVGIAVACLVLIALIGALREA